jgi:uncharacterized C2H2 Zn-finger protein
MPVAFRVYKCPQCLYSLSDSGDLSKHIKCAKLHIIVDESRKIKRKQQFFVIPKNPIPTDPIPKLRFLDSSRSDPDRSQYVHPARLYFTDAEKYRLVSLRFLTDLWIGFGFASECRIKL